MYYIFISEGLRSQPGDWYKVSVFKFHVCKKVYFDLCAPCPFSFKYEIAYDTIYMLHKLNHQYNAAYKIFSTLEILTKILLLTILLL